MPSSTTFCGNHHLADVSSNGQLCDPEVNKLLENAARTVALHRDAYANRLGTTYAFLPCVRSTSELDSSSFQRDQRLAPLTYYCCKSKKSCPYLAAQEWSGGTRAGPQAPISPRFHSVLQGSPGELRNASLGSKPGSNLMKNC